MRAWAWLYLLAASACSFQHGEVSVEIDAPPAEPDSPPGCVSFSSQFDTCTLTGDNDLTLDGQHTYDTTAGTLIGTSTIEVSRMQLMGKVGLVEVVLVRDFRMMANARLRATGSLPLAIVAFGKITIDSNALVDLSAGGAGARTTCVGGAIAGMPQNGGAGGGGGGGFSGAGGNGGNGDADGTNQAPGGPGGGAEMTTPAGPLGGCAGAKGGNGANDGGPAGLGGGAIYLVAAERIELAPGSGINAGGGGGGGGRQSGLSSGDAGGGGGGSGGMILIEAPIVRGAGTLAANGGGGGEASGDGDAGDNGATGGLSTLAALGGTGKSPSGTDGGSGGALASSVGGSVTEVQKGGGGGGGGGVGYVILKSADAMIATVSPSPL